MKFLDQIAEENKAEKERLKTEGGMGKGGFLFLSQPSVLQMDRQNFSYKKEMKKLFADSAGAAGAIGLGADEREERKDNNRDAMMDEQMEGLGKRQKRKYKLMQQKFHDSQKSMFSKKYMFVHPNKDWPRPPPILKMVQQCPKKNGQKLLSFKKTQDYEIL